MYNIIILVVAPSNYLTCNKYDMWLSTMLTTATDSIRYVNI